MVDLSQFITSIHILIFMWIFYFVHRKLEKYTEYYKKLKGMRTLEWKSHLGLVQVSHLILFFEDGSRIS